MDRATVDAVLLYLSPRFAVAFDDASRNNDYLHHDKHCCGYQQFFRYVFFSVFKHTLFCFKLLPIAPFFHPLNFRENIDVLKSLSK